MAKTLPEAFLDLEALREGAEVEFKRAAGRDGRGRLPEDFWETYSAFANTAAGTVVLGVRETAAGFAVEGVADAAKVRRELFDRHRQLDARI